MHCLHANPNVKFTRVDQLAESLWFSVNSLQFEYLPHTTTAPFGMSALDNDYVEVQLGGGRRAVSPPALTPTRLRTSIKANERDVGIISKVQLHRTQQINPPTSIMEPTDAFVDDNLFLHSPEIRCTLELFPRTEDDIFLNRTPSRNSLSGSG